MGRRKTLAEKSDGEAWRSKVVKAQQQICRFIKANVGREDPFDEKAIIEAVKKRLVDQGASDFEAQDQGIRLRTFGGKTGRSKGQSGRSPLSRQGVVEFDRRDLHCGLIVSSEEEEELWDGGSASREGQTAGKKWKLGDYVIGISTKGRSRTAHVL